MDFEAIRIEKLKQKIKRFNGLMEELSQEFIVIYHEGKEGLFHDVVLEMIQSLEKAQEMVKKVDDLVLGKNP
jgi:archaellum component FlaC